MKSKVLGNGDIAANCSRYGIAEEWWQSDIRGRRIQKISLSCQTRYMAIDDTLRRTEEVRTTSSTSLIEDISQTQAITAPLLLAFDEAPIKKGSFG